MSNHIPNRPLLSILLGMMLAGCTTLAPDYEKPTLPVAQQWPAESRAGTETSVTTTLADLPWQSLVSDPKLRQVVQLALDNNRDLRVAVFNIEKARAQYRIQRAELLPEIGVSVSGNSGRKPSSVSGTGQATTGHTYDAGLGVTAWELDLFGRIRSLRDQALQRYLATESTQQAARISLIAEVAGAYLGLAAVNEQLDVARSTQQSRREALDLQRHLREIGITSDLEVKQADAELEAARDEVLSFESEAATGRNTLELLVGMPLAEELRPSESVDTLLAVKELPAGLPSDLLRRRPDILAAEHTLIGAHANIGAARAAFFPSISLTAGIGRASDSLTDLFDGGNRAWSFLPQINVPIFSGGRLQANLDIAKVDRDIAVAEYDRAIQAAFREVADALAIRARLEQRLVAQERRVASARQAQMLVQQRYDNGVSSYLEVLDAQRTLFSAQQTWISTRFARQSNLVTLYKALGGGWVPTRNDTPAFAQSTAGSQLTTLVR